MKPGFGVSYSAETTVARGLVREVLVLLSAGLLVCGCGGDKKPDASPKAAESGAKQESPEAPVEALLLRWCQTQTDGDFEAYSALYASDFEGTKRVKKGKTKTYDLAGWLKDRGRMFKKPLHVDCRSLKVAVGDGGTTASVTFEQYWRSPTYADQGDKRIDLVKIDTGWKLVGEEMLTSEKWNTKTFRDGSAALKASFKTDEKKVKIPQMLKEMTTREGPRCYRKCLKKKPKGWKDMITTNQDTVYRHPSKRGCEIYCLEMHGNFE